MGSGRKLERAARWVPPSNPDSQWAAKGAEWGGGLGRYRGSHIGASSWYKKGGRGRVKATPRVFTAQFSISS
jgi:hypothetical protein